MSQIVPDDLAGKRLDQVLAILFPDYSRSRLQKWNKAGLVLVDEVALRSKDTVTGGELVEIIVADETETAWRPQDIALDVVYEDTSIIVINKPPGMVVHPGAGNYDGTLGNALLHYAPELEKVPRAGIIHRLDKDTSGLLVVARTIAAQTSLVAQLQDRTVSREYRALVFGVMTSGATIDKPIGRHHANRLRMAVTDRGRDAITHYRVNQRYRAHTLVNVKLETGRTHQIRVHMENINYPIVGDPLYGGRLRMSKGCSPELAEKLRGFKRQALHAARLGLTHPLTGDEVEWEAPIPEDMAGLIAAVQLETEQYSA